MALELSRLEIEQKQSASTSSPDHKDQPSITRQMEHRNLVTCIAYLYHWGTRRVAFAPAIFVGAILATFSHRLWIGLLSYVGESRLIMPCLPAAYLSV